MNGIGVVARRYGLDVLIALVAVEAMLEVAVRHDEPGAPCTALWFDVLAVGVLVLPLFARRRVPFVAPAAFWLLAAAVSFVDGRLVTFLTGIFVLGIAASFLLGNLRDAVHASLGLAIVLGGAAIVVYDKPAHSAGELVFLPILFGISWLAGFALRSRVEEAEVAAVKAVAATEQAKAAEARAAQAERDRESSARIAVAEERARIARELHDIVAHSVSVMVLQVGAVRHGLPDTLTDEADALRDVEQTGRTALAEMRRLLGAMRRDGDDPELSPQPSLDGLDSLAASVERAGLPVRVEIEGEPFELPPAIDLSAYRIVQEGLTNALKHSHAGHADVIVRYRSDELQIEVRDDGPGSAPGDGYGHGLIGIRERVKIYGGEMTAGPATDGGFVLSTRLPLGDPGR
ncbi:MAG TPA: sensor histidine kinase [Candidatus Limnocylindrales bacterium]